MANATLSTTSGTKIGMFVVNLSIDVVSGVGKDDFEIVGLTGNGKDGVDFTITGNEPNSNFNLMFSLPSNKEGSFSIEMTGMVTRGGNSESVSSNVLIIVYDTISGVDAEFGQVEYRSNGEIAVPLNFLNDTKVVAPDKSVLEVKRLSGSQLNNIEYSIYGEENNFEVVFRMPRNIEGSFLLDIEGQVFKISKGMFENVIIKHVQIEYGTIEPNIIDFDVPPEYIIDENFFIRIALDVMSTGWHSDNTYTDIFIEEGVVLGGQPVPYKWIGDIPDENEIQSIIKSNLRDPNIANQVIYDATPDTPEKAEEVENALREIGWQVLAIPPAGDLNDMSSEAYQRREEFDENKQWHGEEGQYFLIRIPVTNPVSGAFEITQRLGGLRGPVK